MGENRLSALAILSIESDSVELSFHDIISEFASMKARRIQFWTFDKNLTNITLILLLCGTLISSMMVLRAAFEQKSKSGILRCYATGLMATK